MYEIHHGERYWFDSEDEQIMTENNREFEQTPAMLQLFYQYFKTAQTKEEGEFLTPVEILNYLKKKSGMSLSDNKVYHFGRLLQKCGIPSKHTYKGIIRDKSKADNKSRDILLSAYYQWLLSGDRTLIFIHLNVFLTV